MRRRKRTPSSWLNEATVTTQGGQRDENGDITAGEIYVIPNAVLDPGTSSDPQNDWSSVQEGRAELHYYSNRPIRTPQKGDEVYINGSRYVVELESIEWPATVQVFLRRA